MADLINEFFFSIIKGFMDVVSGAFDIFFTIANFNPLGKKNSIINYETFEVIIKNVYLLLSVVMTFYVVFTILNYIIDPNKISEKQSSSFKTILKIIVSITLLVFGNFIFETMYSLQSSILNEHILEKIIFGYDGVENNDLNNISKSLTFKIGCSALTPLKEETDELVVSYKDVCNASDTVGFSFRTLRQFVLEEDTFDFNYIFLFIVGIALIIIIFNFILDISIRAFKLLFLQIIAPIPILSYILPNSKNKSFAEYIKSVGMTFAGLFIRLLIMYFVIFIITNIDTNNIMSFESEDFNMYVYAALVIGLLLFAKQAPKLFCDILGIKMEGSFSINPMRRIREVPLVGAGVQATGAAVGGLVTGAAMGFKAGGFGKAIKMGSQGMLYGARAGFRQTKLMGVAAKDQKVDKTAYTAGASAVAQAITGSDKASSGVIDRVFNNIGTKLNQPTHEQKKAISDAEKAYNEEVQNMSVLKDSQREIKSNMEINIARRNNLSAQINTIDTNIATITGTRSQRISTEISNIDSQISSLTSGRDQAVAQATSTVDAQIAQAQTNLQNAIANANTQDVSTYRQQIQTLQQQKVQKEQQVDTQIQQQIQTLQQQKTTVDQTVDTQINREIETLRKQRTTLETKYSEADAVANDYINQYNNVTAQIGTEADPEHNIQATGQYATVAKAKKKVKDEKDKLKYMHGPYKNNE